MKKIDNQTNITIDLEKSYKGSILWTHKRRGGLPWLFLSLRSFICTMRLLLLLILSSRVVLRIKYDNRCERKQFTKKEYMALTSVTFHPSLSRNNERWNGIEVKRKGSEARLPEFKPWLCYLLPIWPWTIYLTSLCFILSLDSLLISFFRLAQKWSCPFVLMVLMTCLNLTHGTWRNFLMTVLNSGVWDQDLPGSLLCMEAKTSVHTPTSFSGEFLLV